MEFEYDPHELWKNFRHEKSYELLIKLSQNYKMKKNRLRHIPPSFFTLIPTLLDLFEAVCSDISAVLYYID